MKADIIIRTETASDYAAIRRVTQAAFAPKAFSDGTEYLIPDRLRARGALDVSLVAEKGGELVGHAAFSKVTLDGQFDGWFGLGPIAVAIDHQRSGIGSALITTGFERIKAVQAKGCALIGDPKYYHRFGFVSDGALTYRDVPAEVVQWLGFDGSKAVGALEFSPAFDGD